MDATLLIGIGLLVIVAFLVGRAVGRRAQPGQSGAETLSPAGESTRADIYHIAQHVNFDVANASDLQKDRAFVAGVTQLGESATTEELFAYALGSNEALAFMALEVLCHRQVNTDRVYALLDNLPSASIFEQDFLLKILRVHIPVDRPLIGEVLYRLGSTRFEGWIEVVPLLEGVRSFAKQRIEAGEQASFGNRLQSIDDDLHAHLEKTIKRLQVDGLKVLVEELGERSRSRIDLDFLNSVGRVRQRSEVREAGPVIRHVTLDNHVKQLRVTLSGHGRHSALVIGEPGVGKSALLDVLCQELQDDGWMIFDASSAELIAGQSYIGQLEARVQNLLRQIGGKRRVAWVVTDFHQLAYAGQTQQSVVSALDLILPAIERGDITLIGESEPGSYDRLLQLSPRCGMAFHVCRVEPLDRDATLQLAETWSGLQVAGKPQQTVAGRETLVEALQLAQQFLGDKAAPGNLLELLSRTRRRLSVGAINEQSDSVSITTDDLIVTLSELTGLPVSILDERHSLDLASLRSYFETRVLGQPEAVDCLVERVAMTKAGVTDPTRPAGVVLLIGPTGTGKTELAKALSEFLFGSPERLIRLDMSEFQSLESLSRLVGEPHGASRTQQDDSLVGAVRRQPFSVILLDEFEKAHPNVWDLFLQVFDDGRLTDRRGQVTDFRQTTIIMTSNLGAKVPMGASLGFTGAARQFDQEAVLKEVGKTFRREFVNRLDRVVVLHPLSRDIMAQILVKELENVFQRRGLRNRGWAVEWEDAAITYLLDRGFTHDLGARPLKRAIERYLLAPLAMTIVDHQYPQGDQFLFVTVEGDGLGVHFVDPDSSDPVPLQQTEAAVGEALALEGIVLQATGSQAEVDCLQRRLDTLRQTITRPAWVDGKQASQEAMSHVDFWNMPERFSVLGRVEYRDRIEAGLDRSESLLRRIAGSQNRLNYPIQLVQRLAQQLYLLSAACRDIVEDQPIEAFVKVEASSGAGISVREVQQFADRLGEMYVQWANNRGMRCDVLNGAATTHDLEKDPLVLAISGYGAYSLLAHENGLHIYEEPSSSSGRAFHRHPVHVVVQPQPDEPPAVGGGKRRDALLAQAHAAFADGGEDRRVVRRYRESPSPLTRDNIHGWRSGQTALVLGGNFDLMASTQPDKDGR